MRRSMLFLPGSTPGIVINGETLMADSIIIDLEDSVNPAEKDAARILARHALNNYRNRKCEKVIRMNSLETPFWRADIEEVMQARPDAILATKVGDTKDLDVLSDFMGEQERKNGIPEGETKIICLIETAKGVKNVYDIAAYGGRVVAVFFGAGDFMTDMRIRRTPEGRELDYARSQIVCAARCAGIECYDTPYLDIDNEDGLIEELELAKSFGFTGKAAVNPRQIPFINAAFSPTEEDIAYAHEVIETMERMASLGRGVVMLGNQMIDAPDIIRARRVIEFEESMRGEYDDE